MVKNARRMPFGLVIHMRLYVNANANKIRRSPMYRRASAKSSKD